jgi:GPH family glycoside/pentoside/hexuronide:cation symporter
MTLAFALIPGILCVAGALLLIFGYRLTKEKVAQYQAEIDARG